MLYLLKVGVKLQSGILILLFSLSSRKTNIFANEFMALDFVSSFQGECTFLVSHSTRFRQLPMTSPLQGQLLREFLWAIIGTLYNRNV